MKDLNTFMYEYICMNYIMEENTSVFTLCKLLVEWKYQKVMLMIVLKLMVNKLLRWLKKVNMLDSKIMKEK